MFMKLYEYYKLYNLLLKIIIVDNYIKNYNILDEID